LSEVAVATDRIADRHGVAAVEDQQPALADRDRSRTKRASRAAVAHAQRAVAYGRAHAIRIAAGEGQRA